MPQHLSADGTEQQRSKNEVRDGQAATRRAFPLNDFIARWRHGGRNDNNVYLDEEMPSSPLLPHRTNKNRRQQATSPDQGDLHEEDYVPYPAPPAFLDPVAKQKSEDLDNSTKRSINYDNDTNDEDDNDDDDDDAQSIKSYDGKRIRSYDSRSSKQEPQESQPQSRGGNIITSFFTDASNFLLAKFNGDTSRTRLKESNTEMKVLR